MGTYYYTLRKATRNVKDNGQTVPVRHLTYAYKPSYSYHPSAGYDRMVGRVDYQAQNAMDSYDNGYVMIGDVKDDNGKSPDLSGRRVYKNLRQSYWYDNDDVPADYVGFILKKGRSYVLVHGAYDYEDDRASVKAEYHIGYRIDQIDRSRDYITYTFTNKNTGEVTNGSVGRDPKEMSYVKSYDNIAEGIFSTII